MAIFQEHDFHFTFGLCRDLVQRGWERLLALVLDEFGDLLRGQRGERFRLSWVAVKFNRREGTEVGGEEIGWRHFQNFFRSFSTDDFGCEAGDGDGRFAAETLEGRAINNLLAILFFELQPEADHVAATGAAGGSDGVGVFHFAEVFRIGDGVGDLLFEIIFHIRPVRVCSEGFWNRLRWTTHRGRRARCGRF